MQRDSNALMFSKLHADVAIAGTGIWKVPRYLDPASGGGGYKRKRLKH
jgi:hypothetical protein